MEEWRAKKKPTWDASCGASSDKVEELLRQLPPVTPSIPIQPNTWDCALYALQYARRISSGNGQPLPPKTPNLGLNSQGHVQRGRGCPQNAKT